MATPEEYLAATDPRMAALIARSLRYNVKPERLIRPFDALAESIAYQQLSGKAAATIWKRVRALYSRKKYLDPKLVLATPDERLRAAVSLGRGVVFLACARCSKEDESFRLDARNDGFPAIEVHQIAGAEAALLD